jgi:hypothetical protein
MELKEFISAVEYKSNGPIIQFSDFYQKRYPKEYLIIQKGLKNGTIAVITGIGFQVNYQTRHDCDCEYCEKTDNYSKFFSKIEDAEKFLQKIQEKYDLDFYDSKIEDDIFFVKAVKQDHENLGELFNG